MLEKSTKDNNPIWVVRDVKPRADYTLELSFNDGSKRVFDASEYVNRPFASSLKDRALFMKAHIAGSTVAWNEDLDIAPEYLYENSRLLA